MTIRNVALLALLGLPLVAQAGFRTSTHKKDSRKGDNFYAAGAALDSKSETCWQSSPEKGNEGQWIEIDTPSGEIDKVALIIGWDQDENAFFDYARVKKARVEAWSVEGGNDTQVLEAEVTFEDKRGWQIVEVPLGDFEMYSFATGYPEPTGEMMRKPDRKEILHMEFMSKLFEDGPFRLEVDYLAFD